MLMTLAAHGVLGGATRKVLSQLVHEDLTGATPDVLHEVSVNISIVELGVIDVGVRRS